MMSLRQAVSEDIKSQLTSQVYKIEISCNLWGENTHEKTAEMAAQMFSHPLDNTPSLRSKNQEIQGFDPSRILF